uniref:Uncharacterized protein n=1 Tax=Vespula pensylvanica TaxID=30213 RepID=A0A834UAS7_VESPE|nr:hypothetical protein H0235_006597 [Vespula pensylvanica]
MGITTSAKALVLWPFPSHLTPPSPPSVSSLELSAVIPMSAIAKRIIIYETAKPLGQTFAVTNGDLLCAKRYVSVYLQGTLFG